MKITIKHKIDIVRDFPDLNYPDLVFAVKENDRGLIATSQQVGITAAGMTVENLLDDIELTVNQYLNGPQKQG